jgi:YD repeat-containing protein
VLQNASPAGQTFTCNSSVTGQTATTNVLTSYSYDDVGNLVSMTDARGKATSYGYDAAGQMTSLADPDAATLYSNYDALGRRTSQENRSDPPETNSVVWTYDEAGRVLTRAANSVTVATTYDDNGNRLTVADGTRTITTTYDRLNRPLTVGVSGDSGAGTTYTYSLTSPTWTDPTGSYGRGRLHRRRRRSVRQDQRLHLQVGPWSLQDHHLYLRLPRTVDWARIRADQ